MEFNVKKLVGDAGTLFNRAVQYTEEKLGNVEKTELDGHFEALAQKADMTKKWTEKLVTNGKAVLVPNPGNRVEDLFLEKFSEKPRSQRLSNLEYLGIDMIDAGNEFGPGTAYGTALIKVGLCEQKLGQVERDFVYNAVQGYIHPLTKFLDGEMKTILKERKLLETKRLDLDACKRGLRKARSLEAQQNAEKDLQIAQDEFDKQTEVTRLLLEGISSSHTNHLRHMNDFVETQARYYSQCYHLMQDLQRELASLSLDTPVSILPNSHPQFSNFEFSIDHSKIYTGPKGLNVDTSKSRPAKVLYDYNKNCDEELSVSVDQVVLVNDIPGSDFVMAERNHERGKLPRSVVKFLD